MAVDSRVQSVKCLPWKHEDMSMIPRNHVKAWYGDICLNPKIGKTEMDKFLDLLNLSRISGMPIFVLFESESSYIGWNGLKFRDTPDLSSQKEYSRYVLSF